MLTPQQKACREARKRRIAESSNRHLSRTPVPSTPAVTPTPESSEADTDPKLAARKLKNRESAQRSRNCQKQRLSALESEIAAMRAENARLQELVVDLTTQNESLHRQKVKIEESSPEVISHMSHSTSSPAVHCSFSPQLEPRHMLIIRLLLSFICNSPAVAAVSTSANHLPSLSTMLSQPPFSLLSLLSLQSAPSPTSILNMLRRHPSSPHTRPLPKSRRRRVRSTQSQASLQKLMGGLSKKSGGVSKKTNNSLPTSWHPAVAQFLQKWASRLHLSDSAPTCLIDPS
eukprot:JP446620.1.p1 GENE.JP446620.1~~JP446620.1.p1  ORF type:complete len:288 (-),score=14.27 JP446620.1:38-901(-)